MESNWELQHVGIVVRDVEKILDYYQSLNLGTFRAEVILDSGSCEDFKAYGKTPDTTAKARTRTA